MAESMHTESSLSNSLPLTREEVEQWLQYRCNRKAYVSRQLLNLLEYLMAFNISIVCAAITAILYKESSITRRTAMTITAVWIAFYIIRTIRLLILLSSHLEPVKRLHVIRTIVKNILTLLSHIGILLHLWAYISSIIIIVTPLWLSYLLPLFMRIKSTNLCYSTLYIMKLIISLYRISCIILWMLSLDCVLAKNSKFIYLPTWIMLFLLLLLIIFTIIIASFVIINIIHSGHNVYGIAWVFYTVITAFSFGFYYLKRANNHEFTHTAFIIYLSIFAIMFLISNVYAIIFQKKVEYIFEVVLFNNELKFEVEVDRIYKIYTLPIKIKTKTLINLYADLLEDATFQISNFPKMYTLTVHQNTSTNFFGPQAKIGTTHTSSSDSQRQNSLGYSNTCIATDKKSHSDIFELPATCLICCDNVPNCFLVQCGHSGICHKCATILLRGSRQCHLCRNRISGVIMTSSLSGVSKIIKSLSLIYIEGDDIRLITKKIETLGITEESLKEDYAINNMPVKNHSSIQQAT